MIRVGERIMHRVIINPKHNTISFLFGLKRQKFGRVGTNVRLSAQGSFFGHTENIFIDDDVFIGREAYLDAVSEIHIGSGTMIGPRCTFIGGTHNYNSLDLKALPYDNVIIDRKIIIEKNVWIAAGVMVCPGTHIGEGAVIGAGTCIYGEIPSFSVVVSNGYKILKERDREQYMDLADNGNIYNKLFAGKPFVKKAEL